MNHAHLPLAVFPLPADCRSAAAVLNRGCACVSVDHAALRRALLASSAPETGLPGLDLRARHANLFSDTVVFVAQAHLQAMADLVAVIERISALPAWRERVLAHAPAIARHAQKAAGVFLGFDFHLGNDGPRLIEINTNAGGGPAQRPPAERPARLLHLRRGDAAGAGLARKRFRRHVPERMAAGAR